jgi:hypothetical protein
MTTRLPNKTNIDSNNKNEEDNCQILYTKKNSGLSRAESTEIEKEGGKRVVY